MYSASAHDTLITCPFEVSHRIEAAKLAGHIVKCQKNHKNVKVVTCPLNAEHKIPSSEILHHLTLCDGRRQLEEQMYLKDFDHEKKYSVAQPDDIPTDENWDDDVVPVYDPTEYMMKNKVIRQKKVEPPSVRKAFKEEQRLHIQKLDSENPLSPRAASSASAPTTSNYVQPPIDAKSVFDDGGDTEPKVWTKVKSGRGRHTKQN